MELVSLSDVFHFRPGHSLELNSLAETDIKSGVAFVSRQMSNNGVSSYVERIKELEPEPAGDISCALGGSVLTTFLQTSEFYCGRDVAVLSRKTDLSDKEVLIYCHYIKSNHFRYSYGRQANRTLSKLKIPHPNRVKELAKKIDYPIQPSAKPAYTSNISLPDRDWKTFRCDKVFNIQKAKCSNASGLLNIGDEINYIGAKKNNNGVIKRVRLEKHLVSEGNCITFIGDGQGSVGYALYQPKDFIGSTTLICGYNPNLNPFVGMFLVSTLDLERFRYSFGRKYNKAALQKTNIKLPVTNQGEPDWQFMEDYIKSLPYSSNLEQPHD